eukprot:1031299-Rhodomonas_salina.1
MRTGSWTTRHRLQMRKNAPLSSPHWHQTGGAQMCVCQQESWRERDGASSPRTAVKAVSYTHLRAHETEADL